MEEKNLNEAQVAEQTTSQDENKNANELDALKRELEELGASYDALDDANSELLKKYESEKKTSLRFYRQVKLLRDGIAKLIESGKITQQDATQSILEGQQLTGFEDLLYSLTD